MVASVNLPTGYVLRPPRVGEAFAVERVATACDAALGAVPTLDESMIQRFWARPRFDLQTDAWIVEAQGIVVGYGQVWAADEANRSAFALVHPDHAGRGIGSALATLIERRAGRQSDGNARLLTATIPQDEGAARLLTERGYTWARRFWYMEIDLDGDFAAAAPPPGILLRSLDVDRDLPAAHRILEEAFEDHWDFIPSSYHEFLDQNVHQDDFDPGLWIVAVEAGEPVGVLCGSAHDDRGVIDLLGVLRSHRGRGIASTMLRGSFYEYRHRGLPRVRLNVDSENLTGAVTLYSRLGMQVVGSYDLWGRTITGRTS